MVSQDEIRNNIQSYIIEKEITILDLSKEIGVGYQILQKFIKGERELTYKNFKIIYDFLTF